MGQKIPLRRAAEGLGLLDTSHQSTLGCETQVTAQLPGLSWSRLIRSITGAPGAPEQVVPNGWGEWGNPGPLSLSTL